MPRDPLPDDARVRGGEVVLRVERWLPSMPWASEAQAVVHLGRHTGWPTRWTEVVRIDPGPTGLGWGDTIRRTEVRRLDGP